MMAGMQDSPPEHPDALSLQPAEEGAGFQPPRGRTSGKLRQSFRRQPNVLLDVRRHGQAEEGMN